MRILLVEEHAARERLAWRLLEHVLRDRGHTVLLTDTWRVDRDRLRFRPDVCVDNLCESVAHFVGKWAALDFHQRVVNVVWEQIVNPLSLYRFRLDPALVHGLVDGRVAWGDAFRDALLAENPGMDPSRVRVCGSMKHAVHALFREVSHERLLATYPQLARPCRMRVLLADSFAAADRDLIADRNRERVNSFPYMFEVAHYLRALRERALRLFEYWIRTHPDVLFIVRPHPHKDAAYLRTWAVFEGFSNVCMEPDGDIAPLLRLSDLVVSARSGVLLDAHVAGVAAVNLGLTRHPFVATGVIHSIEERFAASVCLDEDPFPPLDAVEEIARRPLSHPDPKRWLASADATTFVAIAAFLEEIAARPPVDHTLPWPTWARPSVWRRWARLRVRQRFSVIDGQRPVRSETLEALVPDLVEILERHLRALQPMPAHA